MKAEDIEKIIKHHLEGNYLTSDAGINLLAKDILNYAQTNQSESEIQKTVRNEAGECDYEANENHAACYLESTGISGDTMIDVEEGAVYLHDVLTGYKLTLTKEPVKDEVREAAELKELLTDKQIQDYALVISGKKAYPQSHNSGRDYAAFCQGAIWARIQLEKALNESIVSINDK